MQIQHKLVKAEEDDPLRCQGTGQGNGGQCTFKSIAALVRDDEWADFDERVDYTVITGCPKHGGMIAIKGQLKERSHDYRLQVWQQRITEFSESDKVRTLRGEIGILRLLTEEILNQCGDQTQLIIYSGKLADLVMKTEKLVSSCDRLESRMGTVLDQAGALILAGEIVQAIGEEITDADAIDRISNKIIDSIVRRTGGSNESSDSDTV